MRQALPAASHDVGGLVRCDARCRAASPFVAALAAALAAAPLTTNPFSALSAALAARRAAAALAAPRTANASTSPRSEHPSGGC